LGYNTYIHGNVTKKPMYSYLKQTKMPFLIYKRTGGQNRSCLEDWHQWEGENVGRKGRKVNMAQMLCTHECKWKNETC
jgi:hypothetical protein